ncbi:putative cytochrome P450 [Xylaria flabelliformis]|nr:putative cytochrome P450 [Xylaria flabelliformis]
MEFSFLATMHQAEMLQNATPQQIVIFLAITMPSIFMLMRMLPKKQRYAAAPIACININEPNSAKSLKEARERFRTDAIGMLQEGYRQYKGKPWYVPSPLGERLMLPKKYVEEIKAAPVEDVDFVATFYEMFEGKYTTMGSRSTLHPRVSRNELNQNMGSVLEPVLEEIQEAFLAHLPATKDWQKVDLHTAIVQIVARVSSRMFGGTDLSRSEDWVKSTIDFAVDGFIGAQAIKQYPHVLRPIASKFIPAITNIKKHLETADRVIVPVLRARRQAQAAGWPDSGGKPPSDFLQWMLGAAVGDEQDDSYIALIQLKLSFAAIHTSAAAPTQLLYDLCVMPEWIDILREEIELVKQATGSISSKQTLSRLEKLDSFMKESQRFNPLLLSMSRRVPFQLPALPPLSCLTSVLDTKPSLLCREICADKTSNIVTFERLITRDWVFSDGFRVPANTQIGVPTQAISMDPLIYEDPEKFDGLRFYRMKKALESEGEGKADVGAIGKLSFTSSNHESMAFGYGRHACPGRWFAGNEIKMIMIYLLEHHEFRLPGGKTGWENRPQSLGAETQYLPNHEVVVEMRKRRL